MTKSKKKEICRDILKFHEIGQPIIDLNTIEFLFSIFEKHDEWSLKKGVGIKYITTMMTTYKQRCFQLIRVDGSSTDISFIKSIDKPSQMFNIKSALRHAVKNDIRAFRQQNVFYGLTKCPFTNEVLTENNTHIDHFNLSFKDLVETWIKDYDVDYLAKFVNKTTDNNIDTFFTDQDVINNFRRFHNLNTNLRAVSKKANLSILK